MDQSANRRILIALLIFMISGLKPFASLRPETKNRFHLSRFACNISDPEKIASARCICKHISWNNLKIDIELIGTRPIRNIWLHVVFYFKFNGIVYNKFPIDVWENLCEFLDGKREKTLFLNWWLERVQRFSNFNHSCPYSNISIKTNNVSLDEVFSFDKSILPSGQFRIDISFTEDDRVPLLKMTFFGTNAEHDLEKI